jgi:hypothetical protein
MKIPRAYRQALVARAFAHVVLLWGDGGFRCDCTPGVVGAVRGGNGQGPEPRRDRALPVLPKMTAGSGAMAGFIRWLCRMTTWLWL